MKKKKKKRLIGVEKENMRHVEWKGEKEKKQESKREEERKQKEEKENMKEI